MKVADSGGRTNRGRLLGLTGAVAQLGMAVLIGGMAAGPGAFPAPPEPIPRGVALVLLLSLPAVIGALGANAGDRALLAAAAILAAAGSVIAFSGITVMFLAPALLLAVAAGSDQRTGPPPRRPVWVSVAVLVIGGAIVALAVMRIGIFALPLLVLGVLALSLAGVRRERRATGGAVVIAAIAVTGIGAGSALLTLTETRCWEARRTPDGLEYRTVPESSTHVFATADLIASGCDGGVFTARGAGLTAILGMTALGMSVIRASSP